MHPKLQQAIVATRSGRKKDAQHLLIDTLRDNPTNTDAWYLLSQLVESEDRQFSYLQKTIEIEPGHPKAKQRLMQIGAIPVPAPIFPDEREPQANAPKVEVVSPIESTKPKAAAEPVVPQPTRVSRQKTRSENAKVDMEWRKNAGQPLTEKPTKTTKVSKPANTPDKQPDKSATKSKRNPWLTGLLIIILVGILAVFGYWLYLFFFSPL